MTQKPTLLGPVAFDLIRAIRNEPGIETAAIANLVTVAKVTPGRMASVHRRLARMRSDGLIVSDLEPRHDGKLVSRFRLTEFGESCYVATRQHFCGE